MSSSTTSNRLKRNLHVGWNPDQKLCSISRADCNCSFMAFENLPGDRKPQAPSLAARRKHRVEDPGHSFILNSRSRIFDRDQYVASCDSPRKAYLPIHGGLANSVEYEVQQHPVQQLMIGNSHAFRIAVRCDPYSFLLRDRLKKYSNPFK